MKVCALVFVAIFGLLVHNVALTTSTENINRWLTNLKTSNNFKCQPRPRSFTLEQVVDKKLWEHYHQNVIKPSMVVLHRCDSQSGCCEDLMKCTAIETEDIKLTFRIVKDNSRHKRATNKSFIYFTLTNHTNCECQPIDDSPK